MARRRRRPLATTPIKSTVEKKAVLSERMLRCFFVVHTSQFRDDRSDSFIHIEYLRLLVCFWMWWSDRLWLRFEYFFFFFFFSSTQRILNGSQFFLASGQFSFQPVLVDLVLRVESILFRDELDELFYFGFVRRELFYFGFDCRSEPFALGCDLHNEPFAASGCCDLHDNSGVHHRCFVRHGVCLGFLFGVELAALLLRGGWGRRRRAKNGRFLGFVIARGWRK
jgi:hypothetical protein